MAYLLRIRNFFNAINLAIGFSDPDMRRGRLGRMEADERIRRAANRRAKIGKNRGFGSPQQGSLLNAGGL